MRIFTVDSFTDQPFKGNPAAVCLLDSSRSDEWMQALASEMRHSETAFLLDQGEGRPRSLRWFTPDVEVALCGHATLATAHVLYSTGVASGRLEFSTQSGILATDQLDHDYISMNFPASSPVEIPAPEVLAKALGVPFRWVGKGAMDILVELESEQVVRGLEPDIDALATLDARAVCVTARAADPSAGIAYVSRFFAPRVGVREDPVTGSAHCMLAPYWSGKLGEKELLAAQVSKRGGLVRTTLRDDGRVDIAGTAVTVWSGTLHV
ncbi:oxidoreductase [Sphaerisporangium melleum]|uniref:Oxidoreductase n=1 Tax=Sphaerisporangium melleum TaxID=321316 RepID=A0A917RQY2_9ACTN|nr:PhzF family phenazine biosynthesis protein [Sphaerisporangium melleum]GGL19243.1 oxidoreductase [Sphaerisporangium melleum]GII74889.1 oxidoreductase [Sphaerisporangium melleum]